MYWRMLLLRWSLWHWRFPGVDKFHRHQPYFHLSKFIKQTGHLWTVKTQWTFCVNLPNGLQLLLVRPCVCWDSPCWQGPVSCWDSPRWQGPALLYKLDFCNSLGPWVHQVVLRSCQGSVQQCPGSRWPSGCRWSPRGSSVMHMTPHSYSGDQCCRTGEEWVTEDLWNVEKSCHRTRHVLERWKTKTM